MTKSMRSRSNMSVKQKQRVQSKKYTCGCGKVYSSYPAYSTHRKSKHNNIKMQGTVIPRLQNPKRGRPSYQFVKRNQGKLQELKKYYQGLTVIELGLLKMNEKYEGKILSESQEERHFQLPEQIARLGLVEGMVTKGENLLINVESFSEVNLSKDTTNRNQIVPRILILFIELMTTHMTQQSANALIDFITEFIIYILATKESSNCSIESDHSIDKDLFDISMFNQFFSRQENKENIMKVAQKYGLKNDYFVNLAVILSHWIYALGYCSQVVKVKTPSQERKINKLSF